MKPTLYSTPILLLAAAVARADDVGPGTPLALLSQARVQKELKLSDKQLDAVKSLKDAKPADAVATAKKTLADAQMTRLREISYQARGGAALADADVAEALKLTKKQTAEIADSWQESEKKLKQTLQVSRFRSNEARLTFIREHRKKGAEKLLGTLTDDQKKAFTKMQGKAFDVSGLDVE